MEARFIVVDQKDPHVSIKTLLCEADSDVGL